MDNKNAMRQEFIDKYSNKQVVYKLTSYCTLAASLILLVYTYFQGLNKGVIEEKDLYLILFLLLITIYLRMNALHYHKQVIKLQFLRRTIVQKRRN